MNDQAVPHRPAALHYRRGLTDRVITNLMRALPVSVYARFVARRGVGLCYHLASNQSLPHVRQLYRYKNTRELEADLAYLKRTFHLLTSDEVEHGISNRRQGVIVTFDDGLAECFTEVRPILLRLGVPCVFFISPPQLDNRAMFSFNKASLALDALEAETEPVRRQKIADIGAVVGLDFADLAELSIWLTSWTRTVANEREAILDRICEVAGVDWRAYLAERKPYMTTDQVRQLHEDGFTIGAHGLRHLALGAFPEEVIESEIVESCQWIANITGASRVPFAFPYDADGVDRDWLADLLRRHPEIGRTYGTGNMSPDVDFMINRIIVDAPGALGMPASNLGVYLRGAYLEEIVRMIRGTLRTGAMANAE